MKFKLSIALFLVASVLVSCSKSIEYSETFKNDTSGKYLYNPDELILVYYEGNKLYLNWKGGKVAPVTLEENEFFVPDMYKKFRFVQHPDTKERYLSIVDEEDQEKVTYDYLKVNDAYKTPSQHLEAGNYDDALSGYLKIKTQDSTSSYINEWSFNSKGYRHIRNEEYDKAIGVLNMNAQLHPKSPNVFDSLGEAYLKSGDSLEAYNNYKKALELNPNNMRAERYLNAYKTEEKE